MVKHVAADQPTLHGIPRAELESEPPPSAEQADGACDAAPDDDAAPAEASVSSTSLDLSAFLVDVKEVEARYRSRRGASLGQETLQALAPVMVRPLARSLPPPKRNLFTTGFVLAVAVVITVLTSASVALALV